MVNRHLVFRVEPYLFFLATVSMNLKFVVLYLKGDIARFREIMLSGECALTQEVPLVEVLNKLFCVQIQDR